MWLCIHNILLDYIHSCSSMSFTASSFLGGCRLYCLPSWASQWANSLIFTSEDSPSFISSTKSTSTSLPMPASLTFHMHCRSAHGMTRYQISLPFLSRHSLIFKQRELHLALFMRMCCCCWCCAFILIMCLILTSIFSPFSSAVFKKMKQKRNTNLFLIKLCLWQKMIYTCHAIHYNKFK